MRSSKNRSRSKSNRQRSIGNIINRVFDSSGPEGKVRGTPQQIIEKYLMLARDAQLGNDRVAEQNFLQHAEHYTRMLGEAQAELAREQATRQPQGGERVQHNGNRDRDDDQPMLSGGLYDADEAGIVETPEMRSQNDQQRREPRRDAPQGGGPRQDSGRSENYRDQTRDQNRDQNRDRNQNRDQRPPRPPRDDTRRDEPRRDSAPRDDVQTVADDAAADFALPAFVAEPLRLADPAPAAPLAPAADAPTPAPADKPKPRRRTKAAGGAPDTGSAAAE